MMDVCEREYLREIFRVCETRQYDLAAAFTYYNNRRNYHKDMNHFNVSTRAFNDTLDMLLFKDEEAGR